MRKFPNRTNAILLHFSFKIISINSELLFAADFICSFYYYKLVIVIKVFLIALVVTIIIINNFIIIKM